MNIFLTLALPALLLFTAASPASNKEEQFEAKLDTSQQNNMLTVKGLFKNNSHQQVNYTYRFKCERKGKAGTSVNNMSGSAKAGAGQTVTLSQTAFSVAEGDSYTLYLEIFDGEKSVAKSKVVVPE